MKKKWKYVGAVLLIAALVAVGLVYALPQSGETGKQHGRNCLDQLTEEQREALDQLIQELRETGATREEIREAVQQYMEELGIDIEDCRGTMEGFGRRGPMGGFNQLTEEQREALNQKIEELREAGATPEEIREAVQQYTEELGIDIEPFGIGEGFGHRGLYGCYDQLTEEQREALDQLIQELRDAGATREEIREAVQQFLEEQGIDTESCGGMGGPGHGTRSKGDS